MASKSSDKEIFESNIVVAAMRKKDIIIPVKNLGIKSQSDLDDETDENLAEKIDYFLVAMQHGSIVDVVYGPNSNQNVIITRRANGNVVVRPRAIIK